MKVAFPCDDLDLLEAVLIEKAAQAVEKFSAVHVGREAQLARRARKRLDAA